MQGRSFDDFFECFLASILTDEAPTALQFGETMLNDDSVGCCIVMTLMSQQQVQEMVVQKELKRIKQKITLHAKSSYNLIKLDTIA